MTDKNTNNVVKPERFNSFLPLKGSARPVPTGNKVKASNLNDIIEVTIRVRRKKSIEDYVKKMDAGNEKLERSEYAATFGANDDDFELVKEFAHEHNLTVVSTSSARRSVILKGTVQNFSAAFKVNMADYVGSKGKTFRGRTGVICIPSELKDIVVGVFGLDNREQAHPMFRMSKSDIGHLLAPADAPISYSPIDVARAYGYPQDVNGAGQCIALIELGGGYRAEDMNTYFSSLGLATPTIVAQSVDGQINDPSTPDSDDGEVVLDIQVAGAVAPGAKIVVYFAPNTDQGFLDAITTAVHDEVNKPSVISISWASSEEYWSEQAYTNFNDTFSSAKALGITVLCASGDHGSANGEKDGKAHVSFPASSYYVLACGGTSLTDNNEVVWNDKDGWATGGGISELFDVPDYQSGINLPASVNPGAGVGRGLPDISGNADSATGYNVYVDGQWGVSGGTSAVAPLTAGFIAIANQKLGRNAGFIHTKLYAAPANAFKDIVSGDNITAANGGYTASMGWDACTGLGVPQGSLIQYL